MSKKLWDSLSNRPSLSPPPPSRILSVDGSSVAILGQAELHISVSPTTPPVLHEFLVASIHPEVILGVEFLHAQACSLDFAASHISIAGHVIPLHSPTVIPSPRSPVHAASLSATPVLCTLPAAVTVPAMSHYKYICSAKVASRHYSDSPLLFEPCESTCSTHHIVSLATLATVTDNMVLVRLINPNEHPITLPENCTLGSLSPGTIDSSATKPPADYPTEYTSAAATAQSVTALFNTSNLPPDQQSQLHALLEEFSDIVSTGPSDVGRTQVITQDIPTTTDQPIRMQPCRLPVHRQAEVRDHIDRLIDDGIVEPSASPWAAPIVVVHKPDDSIRLCVDYRKLNQRTKRDAFPLPRVDDAIDAMQGCKYFSTLDLASGYWQVELTEFAKVKSAFTTPFGLFQWNVMPFGLCNAPGTFQRLMSTVLRVLIPAICLVYLDDIIVFSKTFQEHLTNLRAVFLCLRKAGLKIKPSKCNLLQPSVVYLGFHFAHDGICPNPGKLESVRTWRQPTSKTAVRTFLGFASYYRRFIPKFSMLAQPLHALTESKATFAWSDASSHAFNTLKHALLTRPVLAYPIPNHTFILDTDDSDFAMGAVLSQEDSNGTEHVVAYASKSLSHSQRRYSATRKELLAVVTFCEYFRHYLAGAHFTLRTDHKALVWLHNFTGTDGLLARWIERLAMFDYRIVHRPGKAHANADGLSRKPPSPPADPALTNAAISTDASLPPTSLTRVCDAQHQDLDVNAAMMCVRQSQRPVRHSPELQGSSRFRLALYHQFSRLILDNDILYRKYESEDGSSHSLQLVVPPSLQREVLALLHSHITAGHMGTNQTTSQARPRFYWPGMSDDIDLFIRTCEVCQRCKPPVLTPRAPMVTSQPSFPLQRVGMDIMGPLPVTPRGNRYILVVGDYFTKWYEAFPLPDIRAETVAGYFVNGFVCRYGAPHSLHTDQGAQFKSNLFKSLCTMLDIHKTRTTPYHPQSDGLIERFNRTLERILATTINDHQDWDLYLQRALLAYRMSVNDTTSFTPHRLMFG